MSLKLQTYIKNIKDAVSEIPKSRRNQLKKVADYITEKKESVNSAKIIFICTHNSRRSHLCQIWAATFAEIFELEHILTFSGGTEATAFNSRAVAAVERAGFTVENPGGKNPHYRVYFDDEKEPVICFSKIFDDPYNPQNDFAAIMTCSDADENCPFIPGADKRFSIPYVDPKEADNTSQEVETYDERCRQIAIEMFYLMSRVNQYF